MRNGILFTVLASLLCAAAPAAAQEPTMCVEPHDLDKYQLLRRLSLDLRGQVPSIEEYEALDAEEAVSEATVQEYLESDGFRLAMRRYHEAMFWPNVSNVALNNQNALLGSPPGAPPNTLQLQAQSRAKKFRGSNTASCGNFEQTEFGPDFRPINVPTGPDGFKHEGWRMVTPYWDPSIQIKVCAYDAQETIVSDDGVACDSVAGNNEAECGCGPNAMFCYGPGQLSAIAIRASLREQLNLAVDDVTAGGLPYTDLVLSTKARQDGKIALWKRHLANNLSFNKTYNVADPDEEIADKEWTDTTWTEVDRKGLHAGVLTLPAYLLRFQTDRARANRFRIDFMCEYFVPPENPSTVGCDVGAPDLTERCTCEYCHEKLEPMAAHFGLFAEAGTTQMTDAAMFPSYNEACKDNKSGLCNRFYVTSGDRAGWLLPFEWAEAHPEYETNITAGPRKLAEEIIDSGVFAQCAVKKAFTHFVKRDIRAQGDATDEYALLLSLADDFQASGYSFPVLVQKITALSQYRRTR